MPKTAGKPVQENKAQLTKGEIYKTLVAGETYMISLTFKNTGQSIWSGPVQFGAGQVVKLVPIGGGNELGIPNLEIPPNINVEPGGEHTFSFQIKAPNSGTYKTALNLFMEGTEFDSDPITFTSEVKSPVVLRIKANLVWKNSAEGEYILKTKGPLGERMQKIYIGKGGISNEIEVKNLLPDYAFEFSLEKPYYNSKNILYTVRTGVNVLNFESLTPNLLSALLNPREFMKLLPFI